MLQKWDVQKNKSQLTPANLQGGASSPLPPTLYTPLYYTHKISRKVENYFSLSSPSCIFATVISTTL